MMTGMASANQLSLEDYRAVKHMDKAQLTAYLQRVYRRGYEAGAKAAMEEIQKQQAPSEDSAASEEVSE